MIYKVYEIRFPQEHFATQGVYRVWLASFAQIEHARAFLDTFGFELGLTVHNSEICTEEK